MYQSQKVLQEISGKAVNSYANFLAPAFVGKTTLQLCENRIIEKTRKMISTRYSEVILSEVDSVEIVEDGVSWLLGLGIITIFFYGIGLIFLVFYFLVKHKYFIIRSGSNIQIMCIASANDMRKTQMFGEEVLKKSEAAKPKG